MQTVKSLFGHAKPPDNCSPMYEYMYRGDGGRAQDARKYCDDLWSVFHHHADPHFRREFPLREKTHQRWFEMYLTVALVRAGLDVCCPKPSGPDILLKVDERKIWVEATCPTGGLADSPNSIPPLVPDAVTREPVREYVLRILSSLDAKQKKLRKYIKDGIVAPGDMAVVAINTFGVDGPGPYMESHMKRSLYGIGDPVLHMERSTGSVNRISHQEVATICKLKKETGKPEKVEIGTQPFLDGSIAHISGVLASQVDAFNRSTTLGGDLVLYPNLSGENVSPPGALKLGHEWRFREHPDRWEGFLVEL